MLAIRSPLSLPETLTGSLRLTPEPFAEFCTANPDAVLELATRVPATAPWRFCCSVRKIEKTGRPPWAGIVRSLATTEPPAHRG